MLAADLTLVRLELGRRVNAARSERNETLRELGAAVGCSASNLSQIERGRMWPSVDLLIRLAVHLDVGPDYLLGRTGRIHHLSSQRHDNHLERRTDA